MNKQYIGMSVKPVEQQHRRALKNFQTKQREYQQQIAELSQKVEFLEQQLREYHEREVNNKKLNESIIGTYQQTQSMREQHIKLVRDKCEEEIKKVREASSKEIRKLEEVINDYKIKYEQAQIEMERRGVEFEKRVLEFRKKFESDLRKELEQKQSEIETLQTKFKQAEEIADLYKQFMQRRKEGLDEDDQFFRVREFRRQSYCPSGRPSVHQSGKKFLDVENEQPDRVQRKSRINEIIQNTAEDRRRVSASRQSVKQLTVKIDRALVQLKGSNNAKLHERINQKLLKRLS